MVQEIKDVPPATRNHCDIYLVIDFPEHGSSSDTQVTAFGAWNYSDMSRPLAHGFVLRRMVGDAVLCHGSQLKKMADFTLSNESLTLPRHWY